jgi:hypothetical protein
MKHTHVLAYTPNRRTQKDCYTAKRNLAGMLAKVDKHNRSNEGVITDPWFIHPVNIRTIVRFDSSTDRQGILIHNKASSQLTPHKKLQTSCLPSLFLFPPPSPRMETSRRA